MREALLVTILMMGFLAVSGLVAFIPLLVGALVVRMAEDYFAARH